MQNEARIKINLQQIFKIHQSNSIEIESSLSNSIEQSPSNQDEIIGRDIQLVKDLTHKSLIITKTNTFAIKPNVSAQAQLINLNKLIKSKQPTIKKLQFVDSAKITQKLYKNKTSICSKNHKHIKCGHKQQEIVNKQKSLLKTDRKVKDQKRLSSLDVHDRLYNMSKSQFLKNIYITPQPQKPKSLFKSMICSNSSKYLKNYVPFEKRLDEYLNRGQFVSNQQITKRKSEKQFQPQLIPNKYSNKIQSRYNKTQMRQLKPSDFAQFLNSSISSSVSSLSRSEQIMRKIQQHFIEKIKLIFIKNQDQEIQVNEENVGLLTDVQFQVLQPFIMKIQATNIKGIDFENKFRQFYSQLELREKMQLRNHETKIKAKYREIKREVKQKKKEPKKQQIKMDKTNKKQSSYSSNYHLAIQHFI